MIERRDLAAPLVDEAKGLGPPERPTTLADLKFERHPMVQWLHPKVLIGAALEVALSEVFARFADKRELQAGLPRRWWDASSLVEAGSLWLDYASDTGDGFDPTYAIAHLLGRGELPDVGEPRRGQILVLGGDQVYPSADWQPYQERFVGPYTAALPYVGEPERPPFMFALPGNHDWYDGLTSFMRLFCQRNWIGGWKTEQTRSYFALKLPEPWWLWAVDTQFDTYVDPSQLRYFRQMAEGHLGPESKVILVTAKPSWVNVRDGCETPQAWRTLAMLENLICEQEARLVLTLTGDLHHYCRYQGTGAQSTCHKVTAGGAGAYLSATHPLPSELHLPDQAKLSKADGGSRRTWSRQKTYPTEEESEGIAGSIRGRRVLRDTPWFAALTAVLYGLVAVATALAVVTAGVGLFIPVLLVAAIAYGLCAYAKDGGGECEGQERKLRPVLYGLGHCALHLVPPIVAAVLIALLLLVSSAVVIVLALLAGVLLGVLAGPVSFVVYLRAAHRADCRWHVNEIFAAQSQTAGRGYKHFLRLRIDERGALTIYAIGVRDVPSSAKGEWEIKGTPTSVSDSWLRPKVSLEAELLDSFEAG